MKLKKRTASKPPKATPTAVEAAKPKTKSVKRVKLTSPPSAKYSGKSKNISKSNADNHDICSRCKEGDGILWLCDFDACPLAFHAKCLKPEEGPDPKHPNAPWFCPVHDVDNSATTSFSQVGTRRLITATSLRPRNRLGLRLGADKSLASLMLHLELKLEDLQVLHSLEQEIRDFYCGGKFAANALDVCKLMVMIANRVGCDLVDEAMACLELGQGRVSQGLGLVAPCLHCKAEYRVLRTLCLHCGMKPAHVVVNEPLGLALLPPPSQIEAPAARDMCIAAARRGIAYFEQVCTSHAPGEVGIGDMTFLSYKLWTTMRGTALEQQARECCERIVSMFIESINTQSRSTTPDECDEDDDVQLKLLLDQCEGFHVVHRMFDRKQDLAYPRLADPTAAKQLLEDFCIQAKSRLLEFHLTEFCGFDPSQLKAPHTPMKHCSNCSEENPKGTTSCVSCSHQLLAKFDYGAMTDAVVWGFVFQSIGLQIEAQVGPRVAALKIEDLFFLLPETRQYKEWEEMGLDFFKLQCYFITHFIYVMADWGERKLKREFYQEEYFFICRNLVHVLKIGDAEILGEFIHCLYVLEHVEGKCAELDALLRACVQFLLKEEAETFKRCGAWTDAKSCEYARYHASWCGVVGLIPRANYDERGSIACAQDLTAFPAKFL